MAVAETARYVLYAVEWIWTVVVLSVIPSQLIQRAQPLANGAGRGDVCSLTQSLGTSKCNFGIAWSAIAFAVLTVAIAWQLLDHCTTKSLPSNVEKVIFRWLAVWWFVAFLTFAIVKSPKAPSGATVIIVFSFMLVLMCVASSFIAVRSAASGTSSSRQGATANVQDEESAY